MYNYLQYVQSLCSPYTEQTAELQRNKANSSDTEALFLDINLSISNCIVSTKYMINGMILI